MARLENSTHDKIIANQLTALLDSWLYMEGNNFPSSSSLNEYGRNSASPISLFSANSSSVRCKNSFRYIHIPATAQILACSSHVHPITVPTDTYRVWELVLEIGAGTQKLLR
jgi:hypothetical protein